MPTGKSKPRGGKYSKVTRAKLCKQVDELTKWTRLFKIAAKVPGRTLKQAEKLLGKPTNGGGPPPFP